MSTPDAAAPATGQNAGLSEHAAALHAELTAGRSLSPAQLELLRQALTSLDRADEAARVVAAEGATTLDRYGTPKMHPAVDIEARHRGLYARLMNQLNIDGVAKTIGRPGAVSGSSSKSRRLKAVG